MNSDLSMHKAVDRGVRARAIMGDALMVEAFAAIDAELTAIWKGSKDPKDRETVWYLITALGKVKEHLENVIRDGQVSSAVLNDLLRKKVA